ncbi:pyrroline-5-carboxylate reductase [Arthrobacter sp. H14]|uniref:pyrroline-5-carboxylate reductase n=1 Tax=Arthrobacter sp. H14 TaxID=1312959 RepID=UPI00047A4ACF|nr:pyrroline-5-carboxylate reductase [Arthrobacter sp. H14]
MSTETSARIVFLGCGSMNEAILGGLLAGGLPPANVTATVRRPERAKELADRHGVTTLSNNENPRANVEAVADADIVIMGVKPVGIQSLAAEIAPNLKPDTVVISVAAAVSIPMMEAELPDGQPVIRTMPNTPSKVGRGVVALAAGTHATDAIMAKAKEIFTASGTVVVVPEDQIDAVSAVSGSGPAYAFYLAEAMAAAGEKLGLDAETSRVLARDTVAGAGALLSEPDADAEALRIAVTSPGGTTAAALETFTAKGLPDVIEAGARAAAARAAEITAELQK